MDPAVLGGFGLGQQFDQSLLVILPDSLPDLTNAGTQGIDSLKQRLLVLQKDIRPHFRAG